MKLPLFEFIFLRNKNYTLYFAFWLIAALLFYKTANGNFVLDTIGWFLQYKKLGASGLLHGFGDKSLHYGYHFIFYALYKSFGFNGYAWTFVFLSFHAFNAFLFRIFLMKVLHFFEVKHKGAISLISALFFLVSPYQVEVVSWSACVHYLVSVGSMLGAWLLWLRYLEKPSIKYFFGYYFLFVFALFSLEFALSFPFMLCLLSVVFYIQNKSVIDLKTSITHFFLPSFFLIILYFFFNKWILGNWIGHYGAELHLNFEVTGLVSNFNKYLLKYLGFAQFFNFSIKEALYVFLERSMVSWVSLFLYGLSAISFFYFYKKMPDSIRLAGILLLLYCFAFVTTINLFFNYLGSIEGDRVGYFSSMFFYATLVVLLFSIKPLFRYVLLLSFLVLSVYFQQIYAQIVHHAGQIYFSNIKNFPLTNYERVFLLNTPDSFKGYYLFRFFKGTSSFGEARYLFDNTQDPEKFEDVMQYVMASTTDSVKVEVLSDNQLRVSLAQYGGWFKKAGLGAVDFENKTYKIEIEPQWRMSYVVTFYDKKPGDRFVYQAGEYWREVENF